MLKCADGTIYTGYTVDLPHRLERHNAGKASKYTRGRLPVECVYMEALCDKSAALKREKAIKKLSHSQKEFLIADFQKTFFQHE
ncbi:MAG: GIY-YIG nuclease family protein [Syntrophomonadaceae bacterium]|jgi:putative endonuclease|nr:GIY-YIG nuclease family protein [Syntrophomonadaceae bacterium]